MLFALAISFIIEYGLFYGVFSWHSLKKEVVGFSILSMTNRSGSHHSQTRRLSKICRLVEKQFLSVKSLSLLLLVSIVRMVALVMDMSLFM